MIIIMEPTATQEEIQKVVEKMEDLGFKIILNQGQIMTVVAAIGDKRLIEPQAIASMSGVREVKLIQEPFKMACRESQKDDSIIELGNGIKIGGNEPPVIMAGPCSVEDDKEGLLKVAHAIKATGAQVLRGGAFKPRTSPYDFQGLEETGLKYLAEAREQTGLLIVTEVMDSQEIDLVAQYTDIVQVGARNMQNFKLLKALGRIDKPILLKRGPSATIREFLLAAEHIMYAGNSKVILCERGVKGIDSTYTRNTLDIAAVPIIKKYSHLPIMVDPSHGTGRRYLVSPMSKSALIAGAHGLMVEVHHNPDKAYSDGAQSLTIEQFTMMMQELNEMIEKFIVFKAKTEKAAFSV
ncbi:MAG: 3-deoxy-7-phosphoheptulonate synthase [Candidatus Melainabacteria bacterium RIFOXYA12_FULL_32_12]|nr:MAG: 3-deoxy-7-phosphoheptulonate synthase [Candidatus Melainabacteria bacterium RIFOXYA2_FULL_32_9]OGI25306.1 MAG: 3-deoxy-7-phosphoheptulonate synthase [Candidatus Melainabacteria bacterium RIFOXYA12_FULL_32_12]